MHWRYVGSCANIHRKPVFRFVLCSSSLLRVCFIVIRRVIVLIQLKSTWRIASVVCRYGRSILQTARRSWRRGSWQLASNYKLLNQRSFQSLSQPFNAYDPIVFGPESNWKVENQRFTLEASVGLIKKIWELSSVLQWFRTRLMFVEIHAFRLNPPELMEEHMVRQFLRRSIPIKVSSMSMTDFNTKSFILTSPI